MSTPDTPLVSIVIPCYRGARWLPEALESCLRQTHANLEIIVVDDASPDNCAEIAEDYARRDKRLRVVRRTTNGGVSRAFNTGFEAARGEFMTRLAQDDYFAPEAVEVMVGFLLKTPPVGLVYCDFYHVHGSAEGKPRTTLYTTADSPKSLAVGQWLGVCIMWRRAVWLRTGGFDPEYDAAEDYDFLCRVSEYFTLAKCPGVAPFFGRFHPLNGSRIFAGRQEVAAARIKARYAESWLTARRILGEGYCNAAYNYGAESQMRLALKRAAQSLCFWPLSWNAWRLLFDLATRGFRRRPPT